ncbi:hypothetical protein CsSME_00010385 [Camellia sinensis var. sinensis]
MEKRVGIIGAGISGLVACKFTLSKGYHPVVFEAKTTIGGVWTKTVETTKLQTPKHFYQFSDFPWPNSVTEVFPTQPQVFDYLQSYAGHFGLLEHIRFGCKVIGIDYEAMAAEAEMEGWGVWGGTGEAFGSGKWSVTVQDTHSSSTEVYLLSSISCTLNKSKCYNFKNFFFLRKVLKFQINGKIYLECASQN